MLNARGAVRGCSNGTRRIFDVPGWTGIAVGSVVCCGLALWIWLRGSLVITKIATYMTHSRLKNPSKSDVSFSGERKCSANQIMTHQNNFNGSEYFRGKKINYGKTFAEYMAMHNERSQ